MINQIIEPLKDCICPLPFVDVCEGLVTIYSKPICEEINGQLIELGQNKFPIVCSTQLSECEQMTSMVVPDNTKKSVFYFEKVGDWNWSKTSKHGSSNPLSRKWPVKYFRGRIMLTGWLNMKSLGYDGCSIKDEIIANIIKVVCAKNFTKTDDNPDDPIISLEIELSGQTDNPFEQYTQELYKRWVCHPYEAFGILFDIEALINPCCFEDFEIKEPIENC